MIKRIKTEKEQVYYTDYKPKIQVYFPKKKEVKKITSKERHLFDLLPAQ